MKMKILNCIKIFLTFAVTICFAFSVGSVFAAENDRYDGSTEVIAHIEASTDQTESSSFVEDRLDYSDDSNITTGQSLTLIFAFACLVLIAAAVILFAFAKKDKRNL